MILGIETATPRLSVALGSSPGSIADISQGGGRRHVEDLAPAIERLLEEAHISAAAIEMIAVDVGPGLFTGMRVGIATAQGLALALGVMVVPVRSVDVIAHPHRSADRPLVVVVDARRGEVFRSIHRAGSTVVEPVCTRPEAVAAEIEALGPCLVVGDGAERYRDVLSGDGVEASAGMPSAVAAVELALMATTDAVDPSLVKALYLRDADAKPNFEVAR